MQGFRFLVLQPLVVVWAFIVAANPLFASYPNTPGVSRIAVQGLLAQEFIGDPSVLTNLIAQMVTWESQYREALTEPQSVANTDARHHLARLEYLAIAMEIALQTKVPHAAEAAIAFLRTHVDFERESPAFKDLVIRANRAANMNSGDPLFTQSMFPYVLLESLLSKKMFTYPMIAALTDRALKNRLDVQIRKPVIDALAKATIVAAFVGDISQERLTVELTRLFIANVMSHDAETGNLAFKALILAGVDIKGMLAARETLATKEWLRIRALEILTDEAQSSLDRMLAARFFGHLDSLSSEEEELLSLFGGADDDREVAEECLESLKKIGIIRDEKVLIEITNGEFEAGSDEEDDSSLIEEDVNHESTPENPTISENPELTRLLKILSATYSSRVRTQRLGDQNALEAIEALRHAMLVDPNGVIYAKVAATMLTNILHYTRPRPNLLHVQYERGETVRKALVKLLTEMGTSDRPMNYDGFDVESSSDPDEDDSRKRRALRGSLKKLLRYPDLDGNTLGACLWMTRHAYAKLETREVLPSALRTAIDTYFQKSSGGTEIFKLFGDLNDSMSHIAESHPQNQALVRLIDLHLLDTDGQRRARTEAASKPSTRRNPETFVWQGVENVARMEALVRKLYPSYQRGRNVEDALINLTSLAATLQQKKHNKKYLTVFTRLVEILAQNDQIRRRHTSRHYNWAVIDQIDEALSKITTTIGQDANKLLPTYDPLDPNNHARNSTEQRVKRLTLKRYQKPRFSDRVAIAALYGLKFAGLSNSTVKAIRERLHSDAVSPEYVSHLRSILEWRRVYRKDARARAFLNTLRAPSVIDTSADVEPEIAPATETRSLQAMDSFCDSNLPAAQRIVAGIELARTVDSSSFGPGDVRLIFNVLDFESRTFDAENSIIQQLAAEILLRTIDDQLSTQKNTNQDLVNIVGSLFIKANQHGHEKTRAILLATQKLVGGGTRKELISDTFDRCSGLFGSRQ